MPSAAAAHLAPSRAARYLALAGLALVVGCSAGERPANDEPNFGRGHIFVDSVTGIALDLPVNWSGRYRVGRGISEQADGLRDEVAVQFVRGDSSVATDAPMLVARVFEAAAWQRIEGDSAARAVFGSRVGGEGLRTLVIRRATENPFPPGTADALGYDTLMIALYQRPLRAALRAPATPGVP